MTSRGSQQSEYNYVQEKVYEQIRKAPVNYTVTDFQKMKSQKRIKKYAEIRFTVSSAMRLLKKDN